MDHSKPNNTDINLIAIIKKKPAQKAGFFFMMVFEMDQDWLGSSLKIGQTKIPSNPANKTLRKATL
jgi:hypothetical protein